MQLEPEDPEGSPYIPSVGSASAQPTTAGVEAFSVADNTSTLSAGNENLYLPKTQTSGPSFTTQSITNGSDSFTPYEPAPVADDNPYVPKAAVGPPPPARSMSNGSIYSPRTSISNDAYDPYAPSRHPRRQQTPSDSLGPPQELLVKAPTHTPYAPSPSLLGTNDPLGRTSARVPVFSFGFGGRIVTCFHGADKLSTGFDVALASRNSTGIQIRILNKVVPESALDLSPSSFPGPLFSDPGSPTTGLVRPGASAQMKTKKTRVVKYLTDRAKEISQGLGYLHAGSLEKRQAEGKLVLVKLLKIMIEHDGKLLGTSQAETAVRSALVPELELSGNSADTDTFTTTTFATVGEDGTLKSQLQLGDASDPPITVASLRPSSLDKIQDFLLRGERRKAYHFALDQKLWAHAMVIASGIDREAWKEVVNEFLRTELGSKDITSRTATYGQVPNGTASLANGREPLRVAYSLFSGQGAAAVQELIPQNPMAAPQLVRLPLPPVSHTTPMTPNFATQIPVANIPVESLSKWAEMISMMISSTMSSETSSALTALGDQLCGNQWVEAGHVCYLLSSQTSPIGGVGNPSARVVLLGAPNPQTSTKFLRDTDAIIFSEILEFAMGLTPPVKGHEPFQGLAHLQAYRLVRALFLAEIGEISLANRYCEAITASMNRGSPYFTQVLSDQLKGLSNRIAGTSHSDKSGSWMGSKIGKPSLDSIGGWLEGRFTKLVTGDSEDNGGDANEMKSEGQGFVGPFSHYSAISSTTTSNDPSPQSSVVSLNMYAPSHSTYAPNRTGSSMSNRSLLSNGPQERAASAMDYAPRRKASPGPKIASASASTTTFAQSRSFGPSVYSPPGTARQDEMTPRLSSDINEEDEGQEVSWWGGDNGRTPTTATFVQLSGGHAPVASSDGFISLMDNNNFMVQPQASSSSSVRLSTADEEEEDLGFGNSKKPRSRSPDGEGAEDAKTPATKEPVVAAAAAASAPQRPDIKPAQAANAGSGSWLSRWWKRDSTPGPVKANLGEEKTFYYDAELKRWVNKGAGEPEAAKPAAPPPPPSRAPSRAQTASPGTSRPRPPSTGPPPARPASAADLSAPPPPKTIMRVKSNLVPTPEIPEVPGSAPSTPTGTRLAPPGPPPGRPRSQASKRNIRSRYVDVFQQDGAA
ncbi:copii vesicle coat protein [Moniliophthora roreri MCA 2997]|uniref:Protein transport protein sec16 n=1 Tax=Moniliophthora roreri (strain MCA 2997) TaxID=1381753 RepID=V2YZ66_MONRO|nr:copii vesicle coat protein [Moniliophthora roreri MCA 2997]